MGSESGELVEVRLLDVSVPTYRQSAEHHDELFREFTLIARDGGPEASAGVPARLVALIEELTRRFGAFSTGPRSTLDEAMARGDTKVDLIYQVPPAIGPAAAEFAALLDEADAFCRAGEHLLTLAAPPRSVAFRRWFLGEFERQVRGEPARPWREPSGAEGP